MRQIIMTADDGYEQLKEYMIKRNFRSVFLVCGKSFSHLRIRSFFERMRDREGMEFVVFDRFCPNPRYESVEEGVSLFRRMKCDCIAAVGGGSAIDVAKCIKLYANMNPGQNYLEQVIVPNDIPLFAVPTTAGTGSEATKFAVIYARGEKQSVTHESCIPSAVLFDPSVLEMLPLYQKKATMLDALCHATESYWSVHSGAESREYSRQAIQRILQEKEGYLANTPEGNEGMLYAANLAGKAINLAQTTAGHAMCYKLTGLYGIAHGHAAALCVAGLFPFMISHMDRCADARGSEYVKSIFREIAEAMSCPDADAAVLLWKEILRDFQMEVPAPKEGDFEILKRSVNPTRLGNNPVRLDEDAIDEIYHHILQV